MGKARIKVITVGHMPLHLNLKVVSCWVSNVFELVGDIDSFSLNCDSDYGDWGFSDHSLKKQIPEFDGADFTVALVNVPIENNWYSRRLGDSKIVFTFHQIKEILSLDNIPLENAVLRVLYSYTLLYRRAGNKIPEVDAVVGFTHDETRGCIFDMNGIKSDIVESCNKPIICSACEERLRSERVATQVLSSAKKEIKKIRKHLYFRFFDFVKIRPIVALLISSVFAVTLGVAGSLVASTIYDAVKGGVGKGGLEAKK